MTKHECRRTNDECVFFIVLKFSLRALLLSKLCFSFTARSCWMSRRRRNRVSGRGQRFPNRLWEPELVGRRSAEPEGPRKTPPESWPGWLRFRWSFLLDQDGVDLPGATSILLGTDLIIGSCARAWRLLFIDVIVIVFVALRFRAQIIRCHCGQIMLLQFFVTLPHFRRHLVEIFLRFDGTAEEQFPLRIFRCQKFLALFVFDPQLAFVIGKNNLRFAQIDRGSLECAV